ncbi:cytochrome P450 [Streptomyces sp. NPDC018031]|uniref:cytochrome P450 n=1 Tax=Streptomyces sp. NPDC018031 TaxID=3365033 RepID=UPI0037AD76B0
MEHRTCPVLDPKGSDLHAEAARLRANGPATLVLLPGRVPAWSVTSYHWIKKLARDSRVSRDPRRHWPDLDTVPLDSPMNVWIRGNSALFAYGADHRRQRALLAPSFAPQRTEALRPRVVRTVAQLIEKLRRTQPGDVVDLRQEFAHAIPTEVIFGLFGVPEDVRAETRRVVDTMHHTAASPQEALASYTELRASIGAIIDLKRKNPGEDMTSDLIAAHDEGRLSEQELLSNLILMLGAGSETTVNLIAKAIHALLTEPGQLRLLREGRVGWTDVIEETLRGEGPLMHMPLRYAVEDIPLTDDLVIRKGEAILLGFGAAGRDPAVHGETCDDFDATRTSKEHLAFGYGAHFCPGASLARLEAEIALPALFDAFPDMALAVPAGELRPQESFITNGHRALPVRLRGGAGAPG